MDELTFIVLVWYGFCFLVAVISVRATIAVSVQAPENEEGRMARFSKDVNDLAEFMHYQYEEIAKEEGWNTQEKTQVDFEDLPEENKSTMLRLASAVLGWFFIDEGA